MKGAAGHVSFLEKGPKANKNESTFSFGLLIFLCGLVLFLQAALIPRLEINWDEFFFLSNVHEYTRGTLDRPLQTFHVHAFAWLLLIGNEVDQVIAGRAAMLLLETGTVVLVALTASHFVPKVFAAAAAFAYLTAGFVFLHGMSFRTDPIITFLLMLALYILLTRKLCVAELIMLAAAVALAHLVSIKSALYLPALLGAAFYRIRTDVHVTAGKILATGLISVSVFIALYLWHDALLPTTAGKAEEIASSGLSKTLLESNFLPRRKEILQWVLLSTPQLILLCVGIHVLITRTYGDKAGGYALLGLLAPLLASTIYRNAFVYFFPFAIAPAMVFAAIGAAALENRLRLFPALFAMMLVGLGMQINHAANRPIAAQRTVVSAVHEMFPERVAYIDRNSMIASFPKHGFFMSTWGIESYRASQNPSFPEILRTSSPVFVLVNSSVLEAALGRNTTLGGYAELLPRDAAVLRENYVHYWGPVWIAGKCLDATLDRFSILVSGRYLVNVTAPGDIDGELYRPGEAVFLKAGTHILRAGSGEDVCLRWADVRSAPAIPPPASPLYRGF